MTKPHIDVCVATYRRNKLLRKLLESMRKQRLTSATFGVRVADNDSEGYARECVESFRGVLDVTYTIEPRRNIAHARNASMAGSHADFFAFVDDDEYADPDWLKELHQAMERFDADVVIGAIGRYGCDTFVMRSGWFDPPNVTSGATRGFWPRTGNALVRASVLPEIPFAPQYGLSGGEDAALFEGIRRAGGVIVYCAEAVVHERMPPTQASMEWVLQRGFRAGVTHSRMDNDHRTGPWQRFVLGQSYALGGVRELCRMPFDVMNAKNKPLTLIRGMSVVARNVGHVAGVVGLTYEEYKSARATRGRYEMPVTPGEGSSTDKKG